MDEREREDVYNVAMGKKIRSVRNEVGLVQAQLAQMAGVSRASITNIEAGTQATPPYRLARIAEALRVPVAKLLPELREIGRPAAVPQFDDALAGVQAYLAAASKGGDGDGQS
jgi:transcriptional regulator with XRE-family HTH domain